MVPAYSVAAPGNAGGYMLSPAMPGTVPYTALSPAAQVPVQAVPAPASATTGQVPTATAASSLLDPPAMQVDPPAGSESGKQKQN